MYWVTSFFGSLCFTGPNWRSQFAVNHKLHISMCITTNINPSESLLLDLYPGECWDNLKPLWMWDTERPARFWWQLETRNATAVLLWLYHPMVPLSAKKHGLTWMPRCRIQSHPVCHGTEASQGLALCCYQEPVELGSQWLQDPITVIA